MVLTLTKPIRSKIHLKFVSEHGCTICGRTDVQSAHIRYTGAGIGLKPCDSFVVPLCIEHHQEQHSERLSERLTRYGSRLEPPRVITQRGRDPAYPALQRDVSHMKSCGTGNP